jgi:hypothetical protein
MDAPMGAATRERQHNVRTVLEYGIGRPKAQDQAGAQEQKDLPRVPQILLFHARGWGT